MSQGLNITITGGSVSLGAVSQGDDARVTGTASFTHTELAGHFDGAQDEIRRIAAQLSKSDVELAGVIEQLEVLKRKTAEGSKDAAAGKGVLETIRANFSWAYPVVKDLASVAWPALLTLL